MLIRVNMYSIRRKYIPPAPENQEDFDVKSEWFEMDGKNIVISDVIHSDGLRVVTFSITKNLEILSRSCMLKCAPFAFL